MAKKDRFQDRNQGNQGNSNAPMSEFRKDALETGIELCASRLGKTAADVMPIAAKDWLLSVLGGPDGNISEQQIEVLSKLPKFLLRGTMAEESAQSFAQRFGQEMRAYGMNPHPDKAQRRNDLQRIFTDAFSKTSGKPTEVIMPKSDLNTAIFGFAEADRNFIFKFMYQMKDDGIVHDLPSGASVQLHGHLLEIGREREVHTDQVRLVLTHLRNQRADDAVEELLHVLQNAPLLNPPAKPKEPDAIDKIMASADKVAKVIVKDVEDIVTNNAKPAAVSHTVVQGDSFASLAQTYKVSERLIRSTNDLEDDESLKVGTVLTIPGLSDFFAKLDHRATKRAALLE